MAIEVPQIQDEVTKFLKRFRRENTFASVMARDKFLEAMDRLPSASKMEFIAAYLNNPTEGAAARSAAVQAIAQARQQVADEVQAEALVNYGRRLSDEDKRALIESINYSANEATARALAVLAKEAGITTAGPIQQAFTTRVDLTLREAKPSRSGERRTLMVPTTPDRSRTEAPEDKATVAFTGQEVWFAPEDPKGKNPIRVGARLDADARAKMEGRKVEIQRLITLARIKANARIVATERVLGAGKKGAAVPGETFVQPANPERSRALYELLDAKEAEYGLKAPKIDEVPDLQVELGYIEDSLKRGMIGGYVPVNPNAGLKRVKVTVPKEVMRGRGKKRGPVTEMVTESIFVPKEIIGEAGSREAVFDRGARFRAAVRDKMLVMFGLRDLDPALMDKAAKLVADKAQAKARGLSFEIPEEYRDAVRTYGEIRAWAMMEVKAETPTSGATRIAKGTEFQSREESRAYRKAFKKGPAIIRELLATDPAGRGAFARGVDPRALSDLFAEWNRDPKSVPREWQVYFDKLSNIMPVDTGAIEEFRRGGFQEQMGAATKLFKNLPIEKRREVVEDIVDFEYAPFRWRVGPSGVVDKIESQQADSKAVTLLEQKPEMFPRLSASQRMGGSRRAEEPAPNWANLGLFNSPSLRGKSKQQRLVASVYLNPDWITSTFGGEALRRVIADKVAQGYGAAAETSITRLDLAQAGYSPFGEEADIAASEVPVTLFARALDKWNKDTFRRRNENVTFAPMILVGKGANRRLVSADSKEGKRFLVETNATAYLYGGPDARSLRKERKDEKALIKLAEELITEDLIGEGFDPDQNPKLFYGKIEELMPLRVNAMLLDNGPLVSQNLIDAANLYNERLRSKTIAPRQAAAGGLKAKPIRAAAKSNEAIRAEAAERVSERYSKKIEGLVQPPKLTVDQIVEKLKAAKPGRTGKSMRAHAVNIYNAAIQNYAERYQDAWDRVAENYDADVAEEERRLRQARGVIGFRRTKEQAAAVRAERGAQGAQDQERERMIEEGEAQFRQTLSRERGAYRRDKTKEGKMPFILSEEKTPETEIEALQQEKRIKGSSFPGFKEKRLRKLLAQQRLIIQKRGMSGLGFGFGAYDLGSKITGIAVGGLVVYSLFKAIQSGLKKE